MVFVSPCIKRRVYAHPTIELLVDITLSFRDGLLDIVFAQDGRRRRNEVGLSKFYVVLVQLDLRKKITEGE